MSAPDKRDHTSNRERAEPGGLVVRRGYRQADEGSGLVPDTAIVAGDHAEAIFAGTKIVVERLPARAHVLPVRIVALELDAKTVPFRRNEAERGVVNLQVAGRGGHVEATVATGFAMVRLAVRADLVDVHRRRKIIEGK